MTPSAPAGDLHLLPDELENVPRAGAVGSLQTGELVVDEPVSRVLGRESTGRRPGSGGFLRLSVERGRGRSAAFTSIPSGG